MHRLPFSLALLLSLPLAASPDCNVSIGMSPTLHGGTLIHIQHAPECRLIVEDGGKHLRIEVPSKTSEAALPAESPEGNLTERIIALAKSKLGDRYQPAQAGPDHFDCSGFVYFLFKSQGIAIPRSSRTQAESGPKIARKQLRRGDLLFFDTHNRHHVNHAGLYLGDGKFIHSSSGHAYGVTISDLDKGFYRDKFLWGVRKIPENPSR
jgi:cell wall-associated NlpC family hydrolase